MISKRFPMCYQAISIFQRISKRIPIDVQAFSEWFPTSFQQISKRCDFQIISRDFQMISEWSPRALEIIPYCFPYDLHMISEWSLRVPQVISKRLASYL